MNVPGSVYAESLQNLTLKGASVSMFHSFSSRTVMFFCILSFSLIHLCGCHAAPSETTAAVQTTEEAEDALTISSDDNIYYLSVASSSDILLPDEWECSDGKIIKLIKYPYSELGSDRKLVQGCQAGKISIYIGGTAVQTELIPELALLDIPYIYSGKPDDFQDFSLSLMEWMQPYYEKQDLLLLNWHMSATNKVIMQEPVNSIEDFQKLKIRVMQNSERAGYWNSLGAETFLIPFDEIYYYLQYNKINAIDGGFWTLKEQDYNLLNSFKYLMDIGFTSATAFVMNLDEYNRLPASVQDGVKELSEEHMGRLPLAQYEELFQQFTYIDLNGSILQTLKDNRQIVIDNLKNTLGDSTVSDFLLYTENLHDSE